MAKRVLLVALALAIGAGTASAMDMNPCTMFFNTGFGIGNSTPLLDVNSMGAEDTEFDAGIVLAGYTL